LRTSWITDVIRMASTANDTIAIVSMAIACRLLSRTPGIRCCARGILLDLRAAGGAFVRQQH